MKKLIEFIRKLFVPLSKVTIVKTAKAIKLYSEYYRKQSEKYARIADSVFSVEERERAKYCKEGDATNILSGIAVKWLTKHCTKDVKYKEIFITQRPNTKMLLRSHSDGKLFIFKDFNPYFNFYFASWYYKFNWERLVNKWLEE